MGYCKFCGKQVNAMKWLNNDREYTCSECTHYCMNNCKNALNTNTSWHTEPCLSCKHNPYLIMYKWVGGKWQKK